MTCDFSPTAVHGYFDGELDAVRAADFERHLEVCVECRNSLEQMESLRRRIRRSALRSVSAKRGSVSSEASSIGVCEVPAANVIFAIDVSSFFLRYGTTTAVSRSLFAFSQSPMFWEKMPELYTPTAE